MKIIEIALLAFLLILAETHGKHYNCQFDTLYKDLKPSADFYAKLDEPMYEKPTHGRELIVVTRQAIRITLDTTYFSGTIQAGVNGANTTTSANLAFILRSMQVVQSFFQARLQVAAESKIYSPSNCVDFSPPSNDVTNGIAGSDLHIYVRYLTDGNKSYQATGKSCKYHGSTGFLPTTVGLPDVTLQQGRPTCGRILFNTYQIVDQFTTLTNMVFQGITSTAIHECTHILGFDSTLYIYYLSDANGNTYNTTTMIGTNINVNRPSTTLLMTPYVTAWAQNYFACPNLTGMVLQNQDSTGVGSGSHWERTAMYDQLMTATSFGATKGMSGLTFAIFKDMGWYNVDDTFNETTNFGYQKGCSFFNDACYSSTTFSDTFCNAVTQANLSLCETDFFSKSICTNTANLMSDGCGMYGPYFTCVDPSSSDDGYKAYTLQSYSTSSFCIYSTLSNVPLSSILQSRCYPYVCGTNSVTFTIGSYSITCQASEVGNTKTLSALTGSLTCPNFVDFCTNSRKTCPNWCSKNGFCMRGICNCLSGYSGDDCSQTICTSTTTYYNPANNSCVTVCPTKTYQNIYTQTCDACSASCQQCRNEPTICTGCISTISNPQVYYNTTAKCYSSCPASTYQVVDTCYDCDMNVSHCQTCSMSATNCTSCNSGLFLSTPYFGSCVSSCTGNYTLKDVVNFLCTYTCSQNLILNGSTCNLCPLGTFKYVTNQSCITSCPNNYYPDSTSRLCQQCDPSCLNCNGAYAENCTACDPTSALKYLLLQMCLSICPRGFYQNATSGACQICTIGLNCATCISNTNSTSVSCSTCSYGFYYFNSTCGSTCPSYYFKNTWNLSCDACNAACGNCNGPAVSSCLDCPAMYFFLTNISGSYCVQPCPTLNYVTSSTNCLPCDPTCTTCNGISSSNCVTCASGYYLYSGYCRFVCPSATYPNSTLQQCLNCNTSCTFCFGPTIDNCTACATNLVLYNFTCMTSCPGTLTVNQWNVCFEKINAFLALLIVLLLMIF